MTLQQIIYVVTLAKHKNFRKAAEELYITQPSLSLQIKAIEDELKVPLFIRTHKSVILTDAGNEFLERAIRILEEVDNLKAVMADYSDEKKGLLRVGVMPAFSYLGITSIITDFRQKHPGIEIQMTVNSSQNLIKALFEHELDAVFITRLNGSLPDKDMAVNVISTSSMSVLMRKNNRLSSLDVVSIKDLDNEPLVVPAEGSAVRDEFDRYLNYYKIKPIVIFESSNVDTLFRCVRDGLGSAIIDHSLGKPLLTKEMTIRPLYPNIQRDVCYATLKTRVGAQSLKAFTKFVQDLY